MDAIQRAAIQLFIDLASAETAAQDFHAWAATNPEEGARHYAHVATIHAFRQDLNRRTFGDADAFVVRHRALLDAADALRNHMHGLTK